MLPPLFSCLLFSLWLCCCKRKQRPGITGARFRVLGEDVIPFRVHLTGVLSGSVLHITQSRVLQDRIDDLIAKLQVLTGAEITDAMITIKPTNGGAGWMGVEDAITTVNQADLDEAEVKVNLITKMRWFGDTR